MSASSPSPSIPRVLLYVPPAVAQAAMDTGVAREPIEIGDYAQRLVHMVGDIAKL